jgi:hypothetical protein
VCKQFKIVKIPNNCLLIVLCSYNIYSQGPNVLYILICHHSDTCLIRILCPKIVKIVKIPKNTCSLFFVFTIGPNVLCIIIYICLQSCTTMVSCLLSFMADITHSHNIVLSISQWLLQHRCSLYMSGTRFSM